MGVYSKNGEELNTAYNKSGSTINVAYDVNGNPLFLADLTVMTYNCRWFQDFNSQQEMQNAIISANNADIIGFQEFSKNTSVPTVGANALTAYNNIQLSSHYNYNAMATKSLQLSNYSTADFQTQDQYDISTYSETRCWQKCYLSVKSKTICWINTHLCYHTEASKHAQMAEVFALAEAEDYVIITGDFNSTALSTAGSDYTGMFKQFVDAGYNLANSSPTVGFTKTWTDSATATSTAEMTDPCDNIITSGNIDIVSVRFDPIKFDYLNGKSIDHIPIVVRLKIN